MEVIAMLGAVEYLHTNTRHFTNQINIDTNFNSIYLSNVVH